MGIMIRRRIAPLLESSGVPANKTRQAAAEVVVEFLDGCVDLIP
jgi:hypothetical protein